MGNFTGSTTVHTDPSTVFDIVSDVGNLPRYFSRMTSASPGDGEEVHTTAMMPDGTEVAGDAWFRTDAGARRIEWGSEGPNDYYGHLEVSGSDGTAEVEVHVHTTRVDDGDPTVEDSITETLDRLKQLVENQTAGQAPASAG